MESGLNKLFYLHVVVTHQIVRIQKSRQNLYETPWRRIVEKRLIQVDLYDIYDPTLVRILRSTNAGLEIVKDRLYLKVLDWSPSFRAPQ